MQKAMLPNRYTYEELCYLFPFFCLQGREFRPQLCHTHLVTLVAGMGHLVVPKNPTSKKYIAMVVARATGCGCCTLHSICIHLSISNHAYIPTYLFAQLLIYASLQSCVLSNLAMYLSASIHNLFSPLRSTAL